MVISMVLGAIGIVIFLTYLVGWAIMGMDEFDIWIGGRILKAARSGINMLFRCSGGKMEKTWKVGERTIIMAQGAKGQCFTIDGKPASKFEVMGIVADLMADRADGAAQELRKMMRQGRRDSSVSESRVRRDDDLGILGEMNLYLKGTRRRDDGDI